MPVFLETCEIQTTLMIVLIVCVLHAKRGVCQKKHLQLRMQSMEGPITKMKHSECIYIINSFFRIS